MITPDADYKVILIAKIFHVSLFCAFGTYYNKWQLCKKDLTENKFSEAPETSYNQDPDHILHISQGFDNNVFLQHLR